MKNQILMFFATLMMWQEIIHTNILIGILSIIKLIFQILFIPFLLSTKAIRKLIECVEEQETDLTLILNELYKIIRE